MRPQFNGCLNDLRVFLLLPSSFFKKKMKKLWKRKRRKRRKRRS